MLSKNMYKGPKDKAKGVVGLRVGGWGGWGGGKWWWENGDKCIQILIKMI